MSVQQNVRWSRFTHRHHNCTSDQYDDTTEGIDRRTENMKAITDCPFILVLFSLEIRQTFRDVHSPISFSQVWLRMFALPSYLFFSRHLHVRRGISVSVYTVVISLCNNYTPFCCLTFGSSLAWRLSSSSSLLKLCLISLSNC